MNLPGAAWICCQIGAREYYAIPHALHLSGQLRALITDQWVPRWLSPLLPPFGPFLNLKMRQHEDLNKAPIYSHTASSLFFEVKERLKGSKGWPKIIARNEWFQASTLPSLEAIARQTKKESNKPVLFAYSYAALELLRFAKKNGWFTVLDQIDGGPFEEEIVKIEHLRCPELDPNWQAPPKSYWDAWREECALADRIIVNSAWSRQALEEAGIPRSKMRVIPLVFETGSEHFQFQRIYPKKFSSQRPLRVLFLGQLTLRKGIARVLEAAKILENEPVEFWLVGTAGIGREQIVGRKNINFFSFVPRGQIAPFYKQADIFLFPTLSDGFGLTQLEAQAWKLPIIASKFCGEVVNDGMNGLLLPEVSGEAIVHVLKRCLDDPKNLATLAENSKITNLFTLETLAEYLLKL